ncbi:MAG: hypothetical protein ACI9OJ_002619, partial [Myxococcota bacterium]
NLDRRVLERTVELARSTREFDAKKLPKSLRVAMDSSPLEGAGRVEDTINLLAHAARNVAMCAATLLDRPFDDICHHAGIPLLRAKSVKAGLDRVWSEAGEKAEALNELLDEIASLERWVEHAMSEELKSPPLRDDVQTLHQLLEQDIEPDPDGGARQRIRKGVAAERRVSIEDPEMRHGRKSKSKKFNGYKRHIAKDVDSCLILAAALTPANRPEQEAAATLVADIEHLGGTIGELLIDRGYIASQAAKEIRSAGGSVTCRPWTYRNGGLFTKADFQICLETNVVTCPAGQAEPFQLGQSLEFPPNVCGECDLRRRCTKAKVSRGRSIRISTDEPLQQELRASAATPAGRERLRERVTVEHSLAHIGQRQGRRARYFTARSNLFDLRRASALKNLETAQRKAA